MLNQFMISPPDPPKLPSVSVSPSAEIVEGSSVTLTCSSDANPAANYTWYKEEQKLLRGQRGIYHFSSISSEDRGNYSCKSENQYGEIMSSSVSVDVQCEHMTCSHSEPASHVYTHFSRYNENLLVTVVYLCRLKDERSKKAKYKFMFTEHMTLIQNVNVTKPSSDVNDMSLFKSPPDAPRLPSVSVSPSAEIVEGSSVTLTCSSDANPAANYTWYKENEDSPKASGQIFTITDFRAEHSGNYSCEAQNRRGRNETAVHLTVADAPKLLSVSVSPSAEIVEGSSVTLTCSSDANPAAKYTWYKKNGDPDLHPLSKEPQLVFSSIQSSASGEYYCTAENELGRRTSEYIYINVKYAPKLPSVSVSPSAEIVEGSSVTLTCSSDANPAAKYTWYKKNGDPDLHPLSKDPQLVFSSIQSSDSGEYYCTAENELGRTSEYISINVKCE
uniref:Ig-like domain-containing protein n=1 Tax=Sparus aurata TaxID=8175 RepID=A0A671TE90_SPAAU